MAQAGAALPSGETARIAQEVADGLAHAHERGVVHRDLKPGNVLFDTEGRSKVADFGIARVQGADTLTDAGMVLGTAAYISPEQVRGDAVTPASDVYSFGVILYRALAGRLPFEAESVTELAALHRDAEPPRLPRVDDQSRPLAAVAMSALAKDPLERPADGAGLLRALDGNALSDSGTTVVLQRRKVGRRSPSRLHVLAGFTLLLLTAGGVLAAMVLTAPPRSAPAVPVRSSQRATTATLSVDGSNSSISTTRATPTSRSRPRTTTGTVATPAAPKATSTAPAAPTDITTQPTTEPATTATTTTLP